MAMSRRAFLRSSAAGAALLGAGVPLDAQAGMPRGRLRELRAAVRGRVLAPGNPGYDGARAVFNRRFDGIRPPAVVRPRDAADVQAVVRWANAHDVALVARSGGHAYNGGSTSRHAVVVDVGGLDRFGLDGKVATVGPGLRNIDLHTRLARHGAAVGSGSCPSVAVGGLALGGGMGLAGRALGLTVDRVAAYDVVTADGRRRRVDAGSDPNLFWALRGGGGSFAIVTAVHLRVRRLRRAAWFFASYPASAREEVLAVWDDLAPGAPDALTSICTLTGTGATALGQYLGSEAELRRLVAPLARISGVRFAAGTSDFLALQRRWAGCSEGERAASCRSVGRTTFDASSVYVGAINRVPRDATAFVHRDVRFSVQILSYTSIGTARARVRRARAHVAPHGNGEAYQNYADLGLRHPRQAYYGANLQRLRAIKAAVDPDGRFTTAQGIAA